ncbi:MAG: type IV secretion protein Rhs [Lacunisphaera sp.]|nr:type IV secretion protein Rhs [Lacunisphaera sp.]
MNSPMFIHRKPITFVVMSLLALGCTDLLPAQSCANSGFDATKIVFRRELLPIEMSGFFPYIMGGGGLPQKFTSENWSGSGKIDAPSDGCHIWYVNMQWGGGAWSFSTTDFTDTSTKTAQYDKTGCVEGHVGPLTGLKFGLTDSAGGILSPGANSIQAASRSYSAHSGETQVDITESLGGSFDQDAAKSRGEAHAAVVDGDPLQYWNNWSPATADEAAFQLSQGIIGRTSPVRAHAKRVSFQAQFCVPCIGQGSFQITYYFKKWQIGQPEPDAYTTVTENVTFKDAPYVVPQAGFKAYPFELKQGEQCKLVKVTARSRDDCKDREPGGSNAGNHSVDMQFHLGRDTTGASAGSLAVAATGVSSALYSPATLQLLSGGGPDVEVIKSGDDLRQIKAPETFVDIVTLTSSSYEINFYLPSQVGALSAGLYTVTGQPYVTYLVDNPGSGNSVRFTETRGTLQKVTTYTYDSGTGTMEMSTGNGLRVEGFQKTVAGSSITETRTIKDVANQTVSVVRETKTIYAFGANVTQRVLDPAGANLITNTTYYTNAATDGGAYGQVKQVVEPTGRWTRYTYDSVGRVATTVTQFLDTTVASADNLNRVTSVTYGTIPDQDGDSTPEKRVTTTQSLLGQEIGRDYEVVFSLLGSSAGEDVETRWNIQCTVADAAWDAPTNLVTKRRTIDSGDWFGKPLSELRPDGTLTTYAYNLDGTGLTTTTETGSANGTGTAVVAGTRTTLVETLLGKMVTRDVYDIASNTLLTSEVVTQTDSLGRPTRIDYLDGTYELRSYACCGQDMVTDRQGIATNYNFNALGQVDRETRAGLAQSHTLDPDGRLISSRRIGTDDSEITTESHHYDAAGRLVWSKDALNRQTSFSESIDGSGHTVRTTTRPDGGTIIQVYAKDGSLLSNSGTAAPQKLSYEYGVDADGPFTKEIHVGSGGETTEWVKSWVDLAGRTYKRVFADGAGEQSYFNGLGQLVRQVDADGIATLFAYNARGEQEVTALDLDGNGTIGYTGTDRLTHTVTDVATHGTYTVQRATTEVWETDGQNTPVAVSINESTFGGLHSWQTTRGLLGAAVTTLNGSGSRTVTATAPDGTVTTQTFLNDRLQSVATSHPSLGTLGSVSYDYDAHGRLQTQTDARNGATSYSYFDDDQIHTVTTPDPDTGLTGEGYDPQTTTYGYDAAGRPNQVTQPDATVANTTYWPAGQVKRTWGSRTYPVEYTCDSQGRVKTMTTWKDFANATGAAVTTWNYTPTRGFLLNKRYQDNTGPAYTYKPSGRLLTRVWARTPTITTTYGYNAAGDLSGIDYSDTTPDVAMTYDRAGRPKTTTDASGVRTLSYHVSGQLEDESYSSGLLSSLGVDRSFDAMHRLSAVSVTSVPAVSYAYDAASRLQAVTAVTNTATYVYEPDSPLVQSVTFKQGGTTRLVTTKAYDKLNRLSAIGHQPSVPSVQSVAYEYNSANQRTRATREDNRYWDYGYDALGQVTSAVKKLANGVPSLGASYDYTYDDIGNRKTATANAHLSTFSSNTLNQYSNRTVPGFVDVLGTAVTDADVTVNGQPAQRLGEDWNAGISTPNTVVPVWAEVTVAGVRTGAGPGGGDAVANGRRHTWVPKTPEVYAHDADGNLTGDGRWLYTWDGDNRLIGMETRPDILPPFASFPLTERRKLEFSYDGQGRRIAKNVYVWNGTAWLLGTSTRFLYDGWNLIAELNALSANSVVRSYVWGTDLSGSFQGAGGVGGLLFASSTALGASLHAPCYDGNGNVIGYVDMATGIKSATFEYGAFGETLIADGPMQDAFPFRFSTKYTDSETSLLYYGHRYYSPSTGRWLSRDPIEEQGGANLYGFVQNDALNSVDLFGLASRGLPPGWESLLCCDLIKVIKEWTGIVKQRYNEMLLDRLGLYNNPNALPVSKNGDGTWDGHIQQYQNTQRQLSKPVQKYKRDGCDDDDPDFVAAMEWAAKPAPEKPLRYQVSGFDRAVAGIPVSDRTLNKVRTGIVLTAAGISVVITAGGSAPAVPAVLAAAGGGALLLGGGR